MLTQILVDANHILAVQDLFHEIFPDEVLYKDYDGGKDCFEKSLTDPKLRYYIYIDDTEVIGISGIYEEPEEKESAWLGWFGVREEHRRKGYGSKILKCFEKEAKRLGYKYCRLYTNADNYGAHSFYEKNGFTAEVFNGTYPKDIKDNERYWIYSKAIYKKYPVPKWNDRDLEF